MLYLLKLIIQKKYYISKKIVEYIQKKRIDFSIFLLDSDYYKIYEVAEKSGLSNSKYFSTVFKRFMKLSPTEWLENRNKNIK